MKNLHPSAYRVFAFNNSQYDYWTAAASLERNLLMPLSHSCSTGLLNQTMQK